MRIALLAPSGAGKTTVLTSLYGIYTDQLNNAPNGVTFKVTDKKLDSVLRERYDKLVQTGDFGKSGTQETTVYPIEFTAKDQDKNTRKLNIELVDFPGEFLHKHNPTPEDLVEIDQTIDTLSKCDGFIVLLDSDTLIRSAKEQRADVLRNGLCANAVREVLEKALDRRKARIEKSLPDPNAYAFDKGSVPVAFALTKSDAVITAANISPDILQYIDSTTKNLFNRRSGERYNDEENTLSNLVRNQFSRIIDADDVVSFRTNVSVYNPKTNELTEKNVDYLLQMVLLQGLLNAQNEFARRLKPWRKEEESAVDKYSSACTKQKEAEGYYNKYKNAPIENQLLGNFLCLLFNNGKTWSASVREDLEDTTSNLNYYGRQLDNTKLSVKQVIDNAKTVQLFLEKIMPDELAYILNTPKNNAEIFQKGLPLDDLHEQSWWRKKLLYGSDLYAQYYQDEPKPDSTKPEPSA